MSFAGVSLIQDGKLWPSTSASNDAGSASGYHLLVVEGYSRTKADFLNGYDIESRSFRVGDYLWLLRYYPNGSSGNAGFISVSLILAQHVTMPVKVKYEFSFIDQVVTQDPRHVGTRHIVDIPGRSTCMGVSRFIAREEFEKSEHLKFDSFTIRLDLIVIE
jgi:speckle-type POZ protein